jgi:Tol biopolymer transport system component
MGYYDKIDQYYRGMFHSQHLSHSNPLPVESKGDSMRANLPIRNIGLLILLLSLFLGGCAAPDAPTAPAQNAQPTAPALPEPTEESAGTSLRLIEISAVSVEIGVGSPIPVEVLASGSWPDLCAQVASMSQQVNGNRFEISLSASPADPACPPDPVGIPFRVAIPLNMVNLPPGSYTVAVNDSQTSFEWLTTSAEPLPVENLGLTFTYIGSDGNLWLADASGGPPRQVTSDAILPSASGEVISYYFPKISADGRYIAVRRDAGESIPEGLHYQFSLLVFNTETGESIPVFEAAGSPPAGFDWKPGTRLLAYAIGPDPNYFTGSGPDASLATGILAFDLDTGATSLLVNPERGYALIQPVWSPDGSLLSFDELIYMEGKGPFAYYDFAAGEYVAWEEPLGNYTWSPDGSQLTYDRLTYTAQGIERIYSRARLEGMEAQLSPEPEQGYAFCPLYSPDGQQIAYLFNPGGPENQTAQLVVQDLASGERRELGEYETIYSLEWSADGRALVFSAGPYDAQQVYAIDLATGTEIVLAKGSQLSLAKP